MHSDGQNSSGKRKNVFTAFIKRNWKNARSLLTVVAKIND